MSDEKKIKIIQAFEKLHDDVTSTKDKALKYLEHIGVYTSTGELSDQYKHK